MAWLGEHTWDRHVAEDTRRTLAYFREVLGVEQIAVLGICWGFGIVAELAATGDVACGVSVHPSTGLIFGRLFNQPEEYYVQNCKAPLLLMPAKNDAASVKAGGAWSRSLAAKGLGVEVAEYNQFHGFWARAPLSPDNERDVADIFQRIVNFLAKHMKP
jgi:dienelactone hydrolase